MDGAAMKRTAESVTEGHPDKICDQISDAVLDAYLRDDPMSRVAVECAINAERLWIFGEVSSKATVDHDAIARNVIRNIGYTAESGLDPENLRIDVSVGEQSPDIALGVVGKEELGAGDQGIVYGYAALETHDYMPLPIHAAHNLARSLSDARKSGLAPFLRPDGKTQVSVAENGLIEGVVVSAQHAEDADQDQLKDFLRSLVQNRLGDDLMQNAVIHINPTGRFVVGGPASDSGLTGRKIIVDTYGGDAHHGGGAFSGKDATKVDRSAAYAARHAAKTLIANNYASRAEIAIAYVIGQAQPIQISVRTFGTGNDQMAENFVKGGWDFRPAAIIERYGLRAPIYSETSVYGHFGGHSRPWEKILS